MAEPEAASAGVRAIVLYKTVKAVLQLAAALILAVLLPLGLAREVHELSVVLRHHFTHGWAVGLAALLERGSRGHGLELTILALGLDGTLTAVEAWALRSGRWWGPWLVVLATASLVPFELYELARRPRLSRAVLLAMNLIIVVYLTYRARREHAGRSRRRLPEE
jgi:uncharacterized membrane protein (DUF2068 family)